MLGAEAIAILGVISSIISIADGAKQVFDAASNTQGLPEAFRVVVARLPVVQTILSSAKRHIEKGHADEGSYKGAKDIVEGCEEKAQKLKELFQKVIPADGASRMKQYRSAFRTLGKGSQVETLMKGILDDVQLLDVNHGMIDETETQRKELAEAIKEVAALSPSLPEHAAEETGFSATHSGSGAIYQSHGDQYNTTGNGRFYQAGSMHFGSDGKD